LAVTVAEKLLDAEENREELPEEAAELNRTPSRSAHSIEWIEGNGRRGCHYPGE